MSDITQTKSLSIAWLLLVGGASIYGGIFSANKLVAEAGVPFISYTFWQALIGGLMLLVVGIITNNLPKLTSEHIISYIITALLGIVVPILILTFIGNRLPASIIALAYTLIPGMTFIFAVILRLDRPRWLSIGGLVFGLIGVFLTHYIFQLNIIQISDNVRGTWPLLVSEIMATFGLVSTILFIRKNDENSVAIGVALFITAGYWFTSSTSFANPAVTVARIFTDTFTGIAPISALYFIAGQSIGCLLGSRLFKMFD